MTKIKLCGLTRREDILAANSLSPDYIGFVFAKNSRRFVSPEKAAKLKELLNPGIAAVGVFVDEAPETVAALLNAGIIDLAQLHGNESEEDIRLLKTMTNKPLIRAFRVRTPEDLRTAAASRADHILLDSGAGTGTVFDWSLLRDFDRPYFLAGGLHPGNAAEAVTLLRPYALDVSSGIETDGRKDPRKMKDFVTAVRHADQL
ncbi:MAG: phosphoribosylanthranilate isomerase [Lachnospiraceae bacterium]|nr:phosphoribosylanthranilate isomerase [Lachnospiraceae bacterium]